VFGEDGTERAVVLSVESLGESVVGEGGLQQGEAEKVF
jgi:hypothetical protein